MIAAAGMGDRSRPLRALALVLLCYGAGRALVVWLPASSSIVPVEREVVARRQDEAAPPTQGFAATVPASKPMFARTRGVPPPEAIVTRPQAGGDFVRVAGTALAQSAPLAPPEPIPGLDFAVPTTPPLVQTLPSTQASSHPSQWSGSFYAVTRGSAVGGLTPMLGGTQAGVRFYRRLGGPVAATMSLSASPGAQGTREATLGVAIRRGNVGVIAERSITARGRGVAGFRLLAFGGIAQPVGARVQLEGYGQAGVAPVGAFADGALALQRSVGRVANADMSIGVSGWGSIQRGARRIDVGPQLVARLPVGARQLRVSAEWRERIAGNARPSSGPSITVGADF